MNKKYRKSVGAFLINRDGYIYFFRRVDFKDNWQTVEGGIDENEDVLTAVYRELKEEIGIDKKNLILLQESKDFFRYDFKNGIEKFGFHGQDKKFFLFEFIGNEKNFIYDIDKNMIEFSEFKLVDKKEAPNLVPDFKREIYLKVIEEFNNYLK
jgi:putative (di)nucleoside polyphosphate hydrolase